MLSPKRVRHRKVQKGRMKGKATRGNYLAFGDYGIMALESAWITAQQIEAGRIAMTRFVKRGGKTWIRVFPDKSYTKKPAETRMGKGKGSPEGWVAVADGYDKPEASSPRLLDDFKKQVSDYQARTGRSMSHVRDFLDCVKSRRQTIANPVMMHRTMTTVHAANICMWLKRDMRFDTEQERFVNDPEANRLLSRAMREPWII